MAKEFLITDIVGQKAFNQISKLSGELASLKTQMAETVNEMKQSGLDFGKVLGINPKTLEELQVKTDAYNNAVKRLNKAETELAELQKKYRDVLAQVNRTVADAVKEAKQKADLDVKIARAAQAQEKAEQAKLQTLIKEAQAEKALNSAVKSRTVTEQQITQALSTHAKSIRQAQEQNRVLRQAVRELDLTTATAAETIERYNAKIMENEKLMDSTVDSMTARKRNIGNYASAFNGLDMSVQQVVRELPAAAMGLNTFFLAISNNLPILADEIARARAELKQMNEEGKRGTPVWKQLVSSLFSWQTAMMAGIAVLSMYGKDIANWITGLFKASDSVESLEKALSSVNKSIIEGNGSVGEQVVTLMKLQSAWNDLGSDMDSKKKFIDANKESFDDLGVSVNDVNDAESILSEHTQEFISTLYLRAQAAGAYKAAVESADESFKKMLEGEEILKGSNNAWDYFNASVDVIANFDAVLQGIDMWNPDEYRKARAGKAFIGMEKAKSDALRFIELWKDIQKKADDAAGAIGLDLNNGDGAENQDDEEKRASDYAAYIVDIERQITEATINAMANRRDREVAEIEAEYAERMDAIKGSSDKEVQLRELLEKEKAAKIEQTNADYERDVQRTDLNNRLSYLKEGSQEYLDARMEQLELERAQELEAAAETGASVLEINRKYDTMIESEKEKMASKRAEGMMEEVSSASLVDGHELNRQLSELSEAYREGKMSKEDYEAENYRIQQEYAEKQLRLAIKTTEAILKLNLSDDDRAKYERQLAEMHMELDNMVTDNKLENDRKQLESEREKQEKRMELMQQVSQLMSSIGEFGDQLFENKISQLEEESDANQEAYDKEIEGIEKLEESGAISTEEAEARKRAAEDKTKAKEEEIARRKAQLQTKQAIFDKTMSAAQTIINTSQAIMKTAAQLGWPAAIPFVALAAAQGAAQLATIMATPIPKYRKGTDSHKGGPAIVGDGGVAETVILPDGGVFLTPDHPVLMNLPKGTQVLPESFVTDAGMVKSDLLTLMEMRDADGVPVIYVDNDWSGLERRIGKLEKSMVAAFERAAKESRRAQYESFKKRF